MTESALPEAQQISEWIRVLDERSAELQSEINPLVQEQTANRERRRLLTDLLSSYTDKDGAGGPLVSFDSIESIGDRVRRQVREILVESGGQMHINDIHAEFVKRGFEVPGQGRPANITTHLTGRSEIVSPQRGYYGLSSVVGPVKKKPTTRRKVKKRAK